MTVCGIVASAPDRIVAWADSLTVGGGAPARHINKLAINPLAHVVATGAGSGPVLAEADQVVHHAASFEEILERLPTRLRLRARYGTDAIYGVAGFDPGLGRVIVNVLRGPFFWPQPSTAFLAPAVEAPRPESVLAALDVALVQRGVSIAGGSLLMAELSPTGIWCRILFDLDRGELDLIRPVETTANHRRSAQGVTRSQTAVNAISGRD